MSEDSPDQKKALTIAGRILPGWMSEAMAVGFLTSSLVPPLDEAAAKRLWQEFFERSRQAKPSPYTPGPQSMTEEDQEHADRFIEMARRIGGTFGSVTGVVKLDARSILVDQHIVVTERSTDYAALSPGDEGWRSEFLPLTMRAPQIGMRYAVGYPAHEHPCNTTILYEIPYAEFAFLPQGNGSFAITELPRYLMAAERNGQLTLRNGYHRTLARIRATPPSEVPYVLAAVFPFSQSDQVAEHAMSARYSELPPASMYHYMQEGLYLDVQMRRKRYQIEVKARWRAIDDVE